MLVFGAGTNYALLLISRYREELAHAPHHRDALRTAVRNAGPAILASNATVVLALLTLLLAVVPSTRSLGAQAACGLVVAAVFVLGALPPLLALFGPRLFWPFIPARGGGHAAEEPGAWYRVATWVSNHAGRVAAVALAALTILCGGLLDTPVGLSQTDQFRVKAESVTAYDTLAAHFPSGLTSPTTVIGRTDRADEVQRAIDATPGVVSASDAGRSDGGLTQFSVVIDAPPASGAAFDVIDALRGSVRAVDADALVGGADAQALDARDAAQRDQRVVIPAILAVVLLVLFVLLRAALAPLILVGVTVLSAVAALGLGGWTSVHVFGFPALDNTTPLVRVPVPRRARGGLHDLPGDAGARGDLPARHPRGHRARGLGDRRSHHQCRDRPGRRVRRTRRATADRADPDRHHRRTRHPPGHLPGAHRHHPRPVHPHRTAHLVAGPSRFDDANPRHEGCVIMTEANSQVPQGKSAVKTWRWVAAVLALSQLAAPPVIDRVFGNFLSSGATNEALITPAGWAFSLWGVITLLSAVTSVAVLRVGLGAPWETRMLVGASVTFTGFSTWLIIAAQDWLWLTVVVFAIMVAALIDVMRLLVRHAEDLTCPAWLRRLATLTFGLYLGWSSVAVFVNVAAALIHSGVSPTETTWQAGVLAAATAAAVGLTVALRGTPGYVAAAAWALIAAAIGAAHRGSSVLAGASAAATILIAVVAVVAYRSRPGRTSA